MNSLHFERESLKSGAQFSSYCSQAGFPQGQEMDLLGILGWRDERLDPRPWLGGNLGNSQPISAQPENPSSWQVNVVLVFSLTNQTPHMNGTRTFHRCLKTCQYQERSLPILWFIFLFREFQVPQPFPQTPVFINKSLPIGVMLWHFILLFYSILFYSILFYSILFYSILFHSIPVYSMMTISPSTGISSYA